MATAVVCFRLLYGLRCTIYTVALLLAPAVLGLKAAAAQDQLPGQDLATVQAAEAAVKEATRAYAKGDYDQAAAYYQRAIDAGLANPALFYNFANALQQQGAHGKAFAYYRLAQQLQPRDPDLSANLAKLPRSPSTSLVEQGLLMRVLSAPRRLLGLKELQYLFLFSYSLFWLLLLLRAYRSATRIGSDQSTVNKRPPLSTLTMGIAAMVLYSGFALFFLTEAPDRSFQVAFALFKEQPAPAIVVEEVTARSGDGDEFAAVFRLDLGESVQSLERREDWIKVQMKSGRIGWVPENSLLVLYR